MNWACTGACVLLLTVPGLAADAVQRFDVQEFNRRGKDLIDVPISVEGRVSLLARTELRFRNCTIPFKSNVPLVVAEKTRTVEVTGHPAGYRDRNGVEHRTFVIKSIRATDDDLTVFRQRMNALKRTDPAKSWYDLAEWARSRGKFYNDHELLTRADEAFLKGAKVERHSLAENDPQGLLELAERLTQRGVAEAVVQELVHEFCLEQVTAARKSSGAERTNKLQEALREITNRLDGSTRPRTVVRQREQQEYRKSPIAAYAATGDAERPELHRFLYLDVQEELLRGELQLDNSNGFEIAARIDELVPELHHWAESLRTKALENRSSDVAALNWTEARELARQLRERQEPRKAEQVLESWLVLRRQKLAPGDVEGLMDLAERYRTELKQKATADRLLIETARQNPTKALSARLTELGYRFENGSWLTAEEYSARPTAAIERSIREGRVTPGMLPRHVRQVHGAPDSISRTLSRGRVDEYWLYKGSHSRKVIRLTRYTSRAAEGPRGAEPTVSEVVEIR